MITLEYIINGIITIIIAVLGFFLRRTIAEVDALKRDVQNVKLDYTPRKDFKELEDKIDRVEEKLNEVQLNSISKNDFFVQMAKIERTLERMEEKIERYRNGQ